MKQTLIDKVKSHDAVVGVVGLGYVGLPFAVERLRSDSVLLGLIEVNHGLEW